MAWPKRKSLLSKNLGASNAKFHLPRPEATKSAKLFTKKALYAVLEGYPSAPPIKSKTLLNT